ncbi:MAG: hypothetical protein FWC56_05455 [Phycisphaerae bacterium]|nr:hypothetical protein [Phycisphaerae bacterium]
MSTPRLRYAVLTVLTLAIGVMAVSCNPTFVDYWGLDPIPHLPDPTGSIVVVVNNQLPIRVVVETTTVHTPPGQSTTVSKFSIGMGTGWWASTDDCNISSIKINSISAETLDGNSQPIESFSPIEFRQPALQCGAVIFVNIPFTGVPTTELVTSLP